MAGVKQFDAEQALERALRVFWAQGFERTSYADLMQATGLNKSSLYNAFGDKAQLYDRCLSRYAEVYGKPLQAQLEAPRLEAAIGGFFDLLVPGIKAPNRKGRIGNVKANVKERKWS